MFEQIKRLLKHSIIYGLGDVGGRIVSFMLLPIVLRYLTPKDYGILEIFQVMKNICVAFLPLGLASSIFRYYLRSQDRQEQEQIISSAFSVLLLVSVMVIFFSAWKREWISHFLWGTPRFSLHVLVISGTIVFEILKVAPFALLRAKEQSTFFAILGVINILASLSLNILFLVVFKLGIMAILLGNLSATMLIVLLVIPTCYRYIRLNIDGSEVKRLLRYGAPLAVSSITFLLINSMDRFFIKHFCTTDELGLYALGFRFVGLLQMFLINPFNLAWLPFALSIEKEKDAKKIYSNVLTYFLLIGLFMTLIVALLTPEIIRLISPSVYWGNYRFVIPLGFAYLIYGMYLNVKIGVAIEEKTQYEMMASVFALCTNGILNIVLVPRYHLMGAAWSNLGAYVTLFFIMFFVSRRIFLIAYDYKRILMQLSIFFIILAVSFSIRNELLYVRIVLKILLLLLFPLILHFFGFYTRSEIERIKSLVGNT